jgi:hypothetical protein
MAPKLEDHPMTRKKMAKQKQTGKIARTASRQPDVKATKQPVKPGRRAAHDATPEGARRVPRKHSKQQTCLDLLGRPEGASIEELQQATAWQAHSVRGFLSGTVKGKLGMTFFSEKAEDGARRYRLSQANC